MHTYKSTYTYITNMYNVVFSTRVGIISYFKISYIQSVPREFLFKVVMKDIGDGLGLWLPFLVGLVF